MKKLILILLAVLILTAFCNEKSSLVIAASEDFLYAVRDDAVNEQLSLGFGNAVILQHSGILVFLLVNRMEL